MRRILVVLGASILLVAAAPTAAWAKKPPKSPPETGYDVSYPQCGSSLPPSALFGIVGVNNGIVYSSNPCFASEYVWASRSSGSGAKVSLYMNTASPGPSSAHWPSGQSSPRACVGAVLNADCSYDYGWNAAADAYARASAVTGTSTTATVPWWLDVESANSWSADTASNSSAIQGALDYLTTASAQGGAGVVAPVGIYTNRSSWQSITAATTAFSGYPSWVPGATSLTQAKANCSSTITGGPVVYTQYPSGSFDADYRCP